VIRHWEWACHQPERRDRLSLICIEVVMVTARRGVDAALESLAGKERIIVHCALSQQRGPKCARRCGTRCRVFQWSGIPSG